jgi:hypothetical protein
LRSMLQMDLPHLNVLTKIDNLNNFPNLPFNLDFYTEVQDLNYLLPHLNREQTSGIPGPTSADPRAEDIDEEEPTSKFSALNKAIVELVEEFALVGFETLAVEDKKSMMNLLRAIDRAGGYAFGGIEGANDTVWQVAMRQDAVTMDARDVQERWLDRREEMDEEERKAWKEIEGEGLDPPGVKVVQKKEEARRKGDEDGDENMDDDDDEDEDIAEMKKFMAKKEKDDGIGIIRK